MMPVKGANKTGLAFHACCSVFLPERTKIIINKPLESFEDLSKKTVRINYTQQHSFNFSFRLAMKVFTSLAGKRFQLFLTNFPSFS